MVKPKHSTRAHDCKRTLYQVCSMVDDAGITNTTCCNALHTARQHCRALDYFFCDSDKAAPFAPRKWIALARAELKIVIDQQRRDQTKIPALAWGKILQTELDLATLEKDLTA